MIGEIAMDKSSEAVAYRQDRKEYGMGPDTREDALRAARDVAKTSSRDETIEHIKDNFEVSDEEAENLVDDNFSCFGRTEEEIEDNFEAELDRLEDEGELYDNYAIVGKLAEHFRVDGLKALKETNCPEDAVLNLLQQCKDRIK